MSGEPGARRRILPRRIQNSPLGSSTIVRGSSVLTGLRWAGCAVIGGGSRGVAGKATFLVRSESTDLGLQVTFTTGLPDRNSQVATPTSPIVPTVNPHGGSREMARLAQKNTAAPLPSASHGGSSTSRRITCSHRAACFIACTLPGILPRGAGGLNPECRRRRLVSGDVLTL